MTSSRARFDAHLSEEDRHGLADGSLPSGRRAEAESHLADCAECAGDVARLRVLMTRLEQLPESHVELDALWPAIRSRIERAKVVSIDADTGARRSRWRLAGIIAGLAAALVLAFTLGRESRPPVGDVAVLSKGTTPVTSIADSSRLYQEQVESLLEEFELRRSMMRPATTASVDRELRIIDDAIGELTDALRRDPNNPALRQLLAASYRQKRDLLKQVDNAS